jgi:hypothetical protein
LSPLARRVWLVALILYGAAALTDIAAHLAADARAGHNWHDPPHLAVAVAAGLFWPLDLIAGYLLSR